MLSNSILVKLKNDCTCDLSKFQSCPLHRGSEIIITLTKQAWNYFLIAPVAIWLPMIITTCQLTDCLRIKLSEHTNLRYFLLQTCELDLRRSPVWIGLKESDSILNLFELIAWVEITILLCHHHTSRTVNTKTYYCATRQISYLIISRWEQSSRPLKY